MLDKISLRKVNIIFLLITFGLTCLIFSCAQAPPKKKITGIIEERPPEIESINVISGPSDKDETLKITNSKPVTYTALKLVQPLRLIVDINALLAKGLSGPAIIDGKIIKAIHFESIKDKPKSTRLIATLSQDAGYNVWETDNIINFLLSPKKPVEKVKKPLPSIVLKEEKISPKEPRLFFSPGKTKLSQILGVDFFTLTKGKSRVTVTTNEKAEYELSRKNSLTLVLQIKEATIPSELTRYIDSSQFKGAINRITPIVKVAERVVDLEIELKEMVPYHLIQVDKEIRLDFNKTSVNPPSKKITPARLTKALVKGEEVPNEVKIPTKRPRVTKPKGVKYIGAKISLDFANADIRNILKLIGEVSKLNIVWGPEVKGTVSMRLKNVPWDQALDIMLETNDLGKRREGNIIWITTKGKISKLRKEEEDRIKVEQEKIKAAKATQKEAKAEEPLETGYITVNYSDVGAIKTLIEENVKGPRGKLSVDTANKTIIMTDIASNIKKAKELKERQDRPIKQVMIEARIVEARTSFSRDIGVDWSGTYVGRRNPWGGGGPRWDSTYNFATNFTMPTATTLGINFANTAGTRVLNATIAFAETEGKVKTLSAPKIITRDTVTAIIKQGTKIVVPMGTDSSGNKTYEQVDATLKLEVTPKITPNDMVIMTIDVSDDYPDYANARGDNVPINTKNANTEMMVATGDTVIIGGIYKENKGETEEGTPWLRNIPILGLFFKRQLRTTDKSELLIFLTPTVLPSG